MGDSALAILFTGLLLAAFIAALGIIDHLKIIELRKRSLVEQGTEHD